MGSNIRRLLAVIGIGAALVLAGVAVANAGPGCPDKPGVCPPGCGSIYC